MSEALPTPSRMLRRPQLEQKIGLGCSAIYARLDPKSSYFDPTFPKPIKLGNGKNPPIAWIESEVDAWIASCVASSRSAA
ncbi:MAG: AlpA family phage regulatory protein [Azoarcus sp.]|nr:AlpA family phage regulatory protein [Azoarcus sp.]